MFNTVRANMKTSTVLVLLALIACTLASNTSKVLKNDRLRVERTQRSPGPETPAATRESHVFTVGIKTHFF